MKTSGMQTETWIQKHFGPPESSEENTQVQEKYEAAVNLSSTEENFEASWVIFCWLITLRQLPESKAPGRQKSIRSHRLIFTTGIPILSSETELDVLLPTATSLPIPSKSATVNPESKLKTNPGGHL